MRKVLIIILLTMSGMFVSAQNYNPVTNYHFNGTPTNGVKINTNLPFANGYGMPTIIIEGYDYQSGSAIGLIMNWYIYNNTFLKQSVSSFGGFTPEIKLYNEGGKVVLFINSKRYYKRFSIRAYEKGKSLSDSHFQGWTITDELPTGTNETVVPYKNKFAGDVDFTNGIWSKEGHVGIGTTNPDTLYKLTVQGHANIGGTSNGSLWVRHVNGKEGGSTEDDNLYLNYANGKDVWIGGTKNSNLINNGSIRSTGILSLRKSSSALGDIISLYGDRIGKTSNYGFGVESGVLYSKAVEQHRWYLNKNADNGTSAKMELTNNRLFISDKLGIGTRDTKGYELAVAGKAIAEEVVVKLKGSWPDYVFKKDYSLPTLKQVEQQIKDQGHLENIPSASEISKEGIALGEMNKKLLQKIEELTLYTIDQEKRIEELEKEKVKIKLLEDKLNTLLREVKK